MTETTTTHESFIQQVRDIVLEQADLKPEDRERLAHAKLLYGVGGVAGRGTRGVTIYEAWENGVGRVDVVEIHALAEESWVQLAGTTIHELGHVLAGHGHGHDGVWKDLAAKLGFVMRPAAAGQVYRLAMLRPALRFAITELARRISDGSPAFGFAATPITVVPKPCSAGHGAKGGKSRKAGTSNRQVKVTCGCHRIFRIARATLEIAPITCGRCGSEFTPADEAPEAEVA